MSITNCAVLWFLVFGLQSDWCSAHATERESFEIFEPDFKFNCPQANPPCVTYPLHNQCKIAHLTNGESSLKARLNLIQRARTSIRIQALVFSGDQSGNAIADLLIEKRKNNPHMKIQVIVDAASNLNAV